MSPEEIGSEREIVSLTKQMLFVQILGLQIPGTVLFFMVGFLFFVAARIATLFVQSLLELLDVGSNEVELLLSARIELVVVLEVGKGVVVVIHHPFTKMITQIEASAKSKLWLFFASSKYFFVSFRLVVRLELTCNCNCRIRNQ